MRNMMDIGLVAVLDGNGKEIGEDVAIAAGDFTVVESTYQHQRQLILDGKNDFKQNPDAPVGANTFIDDEGPQGLVRAIAQAFLGDGMEIDNMTPNAAAVTSSTVAPFINAFYT